MPKEDPTCRKKKVRSMTPDICNRFYRAPEVIVRTQKYDSKSDIWSFGCIAAELLKYTYSLEDRSKATKLCLFRGDSCYPLSPLPVTETKIDER